MRDVRYNGDNNNKNFKLSIVAKTKGQNIVITICLAV